MKKFSVLSLLLVIFGVCVCVSCASLLSSVLISADILPETTLSTQSGYVYAVSTKNSKDKNELSQEKTALQENGAAGFLYALDDNFYLLASVYANKADAELVKNNLSAQNVECEIIALPLESIVVTGNFNSNEKLVLANCTKSQTSIFNSLYDIAISLDTGVFDLEKAKLECNNVYSTAISLKTNFETFFKNKVNTDANLTDLYQVLQNNESFLSDLISEKYESSTQTFSSLVKSTYCKVLFQ